MPFRAENEPVSRGGPIGFPHFTTLEPSVTSPAFAAFALILDFIQYRQGRDGRDERQNALVPARVAEDDRTVGRTPDGKVETMKELVLIIRPEMLEELKQILDKVHSGGMTVMSVMGCGTQKGFASDKGVNEIRGFKMNINLLPKIQASVVVKDEDVEAIIADVREHMADGRVGDGKIFIRDIDDAVRIRTGERGTEAL